MTSPILPRLFPAGKSPVRPYAKLPHDLAADPRLLPIDVRLLLALVFFARDRDTCWPGDATLGDRIGRARPTVQRRLRHLESLGLIRREKCDGNPTGRLIRLLWKSVTRETPPVSPAAAAPRSPVRHELEPREKDSCSRPEGGGKAPEPEPMTADQLGEFLALPPHHPMHRMARKRLDVMAAWDRPMAFGGMIAVSAAVPARMLPPARPRPAPEPPR